VIYGKPLQPSTNGERSPARNWLWENYSECTGIGIPLFDAHAPQKRSQKVRKEHPFIDLNPTKEGWHILMTLCKNDTVQLTSESGEVRLYRVQQISINAEKNKPDIVFRLHTASKIDNNQERERATSWAAFASYRPKKVCVEPLGRVYPSND
jgi:hypothetical protein